MVTYEKVFNEIQKRYDNDIYTYEQACEINNLAYDKYIVEKTIGKEFRFVIGEDDGHMYKVTYDFNTDNITSNNLNTKDLDKFKEETKKKGATNYTSKGNKIVAIVDTFTGKRVNSIKGFPPIHNSGGSIMPMKIDSIIGIYKSFKNEDELKKMKEELEKEYPKGIAPNPGFKHAILKSKEKGQNAIKYTVGKNDDTDTYKTTNPKHTTKNMFNL